MKKLILLFLFTTTMLAQAPGEERALGWFRAFNSGDFQQMEAFVRANYTAEAQQRMTSDARKERFEMLRANHGNLQPVDVRTTPDGLQIEAQSDKGEHLMFRFTIEQNLIAGVGIQIGGPANDEERGPKLPPLTIPKDAIAKTLDAYIRNLDFSGSVLVAKDGEVLFENAYGLASRRYNVPNKITTRFNIGSITKDFTRAAIAQLAQAGKLKVDAPVITYLPDYPNKEWAQKATIDQLVKHTSGLGDIFTKRFWDTNTIARFQKLRDFIDFFGSDPLQFEPGKGQRYSNYGYVVLGAIIEAVSGENYYDYIQKHVFDAVPMRASGFLEYRKPNPDVALGHTKQQLNEWMETRPPFERGIPAGSSFATARDLMLFDRAMRAGKSLEGEETSAGGSPGCNAAVASDPVWTVVVLANMDPPIAENLAPEIYKALTR